MSHSFLPFARADIEQSIGARFEAQVRGGPGRLAVKSMDTAWTYGQLDGAANRIAHAILAERGEGEEPVGLVLEQGVWLVAAILGTLKAGKIYVPLDPAAAPGRLADLLADVGAALVVASATTRARATDAARGSAPLLDVSALGDGPPREAPGVLVPPGAGAYIYYTSGSTGRAKGVLDTHRNVLHNVMRYTNSLRIGAADRLTLLQGPAFSGAVSSLFAALLNGAASFPFDVPGQGVDGIADWLRRERITIYHSVPSLFRHVVRRPGPFPALRLIRLEGDRASVEDVQLFKERFGAGCLLVNGLGATECGLVRQHFVGPATPVPADVVPIGQPVEDMEVRLVDEGGHEVAPGEVGEIAVRSRYLAAGYWRRPDLTEAAFVADAAGDGFRVYRTGDLGRLRPDGCLEHLGRKGFDAKVRGQRVEVAAVEAALLGASGVKEAAVAVRPDAGDEARLVAYVVPVARPAPTVTALRRHLAARLPDVLVPSRYVVLDALPFDANGKLDRRGLPAPGSHRPALDSALAPPENLLQQQLVLVWETMLDVRPIGIRDDFFDLGGHSLLAVRMMDEVERAVGRAVPLTVLAPAATVERLAEALQEQAADLTGPVVPVQPGGRRRPLFFLHGDYLSGGFFVASLARRLGPDQPVYALPPCGLDGRPVPGSYAQMAAEHVAAMRSVQRVGPYRLGGLCNGGLVAFEMARLLEQEGDQVERLVVIGAAAGRGGSGWLRALTRGGAGGREAWLPAGGPPGTLAALRRRLRETYLRIDAEYVPRRFGGRVSLFWPAADPVPAAEAARRWRRVARDVDVHLVPGTHVTCLTTEVAATAAQLQRCLEAAAAP